MIIKYIQLYLWFSTCITLSGASQVIINQDLGAENTIYFKSCGNKI